MQKMIGTLIAIQAKAIRQGEGGRPLEPQGGIEVHLNKPN
jgi:hypothetical protein